MGRPWREEYKGGIYHVIARGNNKEYEQLKTGSRKRELTEYNLRNAS